MRRGGYFPGLMTWSVYVARCADGSLYTGVARDVARRLAQHNAGRGAAYTRARRPVALAWSEPARDRGAALRREWAIKQLTRAEKEALLMPAARPAASEPFTALRPAALTFFRKLKATNTKAFFEAHRALYETEVRAPFKALVEELDTRFARFAPEIVGDPRRSLFRINRDVRFSRDKSPYKTHAACWFYHADAGRGVGSEASGGAGFYFHLEPGQSFLGAGIWMPPRPTLARLRDAIADDPEGFEAVVLAPAFRRRFGSLDEDAMLVRLPRGFAPGHPAERWLRYQSFTVGRALPLKDALSPRLPAILAKDYEALTPFVRWLNRAIGFPPHPRRL